MNHRQLAWDRGPSPKGSRPSDWSAARQLWRVRAMLRVGPIVAAVWLARGAATAAMDGPGVGNDTGGRSRGVVVAERGRTVAGEGDLH
jgi:hypothetical protein